MRGYIDMSWAFFKWAINTFRSTQLAQSEYQQSKLLYHIGSAKLGLPVWGSLELSRPNGFSKGSLDAVPGGYYNAINDFKDQSAQTLRKMKQRRRYYVPYNEETPAIPQSFIPTHSALDTSGFSDWHQPINTNLVCSGQTPFDSYYGESQNMDHISFTPNMVNWLLDWLNGNNPSATSGSNGSESINGSALICENQPTTYNINSCAFSGAVEWSVSGVATLISQTSNTIKITGTGNGKAIITASFPSGQNITKTVWVGKPLIYAYPDPNNTNYATFYVESVLPGVSLEDMGLTPDKVIWKKAGTTYTKTGYSYTGRGADYNWSFDVDIEASNACGTYTTTTTITPPPPTQCDTYKVAKVVDNQYTVAKIIDPTCPNTLQIKSSQSYTGLKPEIYNITVANSLGNTIISTKGKDFDLANFPSGTYYVKVEKENKTLVSQTLVKR